MEPLDVILIEFVPWAIDKGCYSPNGLPSFAGEWATTRTLRSQRGLSGPHVDHHRRRQFMALPGLPGHVAQRARSLDLDRLSDAYDSELAPANASRPTACVSPEAKSICNRAVPAKLS